MVIFRPLIFLARSIGRCLLYAGAWLLLAVLAVWIATVEWLVPRNRAS